MYQSQDEEQELRAQHAMNRSAGPGNRIMPEYTIMA
jgi:hypothetical protein